MNWPQGEMIPGVAILEKLPALWMEDQLSISNQAPHQEGWNRGVRAPPFGSMWLLIYVPESASQNEEVSCSIGTAGLPLKSDNIKWEFILVMKMPRVNWIVFLLVTTNRYDSQNICTLLF